MKSHELERGISRTLMPQLMMRASSRFIFRVCADSNGDVAPLQQGLVNADHDRPCHAWVQGAEILVGSRLGEGEGIAIVSVQRDRLE
jgi:hypothetical protein